MNEENIRSMELETEWAPAGTFGIMKSYSKLESWMFSKFLYKKHYLFMIVKTVRNLRLDSITCIAYHKGFIQAQLLCTFSFINHLLETIRVMESISIFLGQ